MVFLAKARPTRSRASRGPSASLRLAVAEAVASAAASNPRRRPCGASSCGRWRAPSALLRNLPFESLARFFGASRNAHFVRGIFRVNKNASATTAERLARFSKLGVEACYGKSGAKGDVPQRDRTKREEAQCHELQKQVKPKTIIELQE